jgi:hypothetical protein
MKGYKILRKVLAASAITGAMFVMQACYGTPVQNRCDDDTLVDMEEVIEDENAVAENAEATENLETSETETVAE